jgi:hypothetical protein
MRKLDRSFRQLGLVAAFVALWSCSSLVWAQTEIIFTMVGADTRLVFPHASVPGATGIDFSLFGGVDGGPYPPEETHILVTDFEWGPTAGGPWSVSPDNVNSIPGGMTTPISTGIYHGPSEAPFVAIHFYAGGLMGVAGSFTHESVVPEPSTLALLGAGGLGLLAYAWGRRRRV